MLTISIKLSRVVGSRRILITLPLFPVADANFVTTAAIFLHSSIEEAKAIRVLSLIELHTLALQRRPRRVGSILKLKKIFVVSVK